MAAVTSRHRCLWALQAGLAAVEKLGSLLPTAVKEVELKQRKAVAPPKKPMQLPNVRAPVVEHILAPQHSAVQTEGVLQNYMNTLRAHKEHVARLQAAATTNQPVTDNIEDQQGASQAPDRPSVKGPGESQPGPQPNLLLQGEPKSSKRSSGGCCTLCGAGWLFLLLQGPLLPPAGWCATQVSHCSLWASQAISRLLLRNSLCLAAHCDKLRHVCICQLGYILLASESCMCPCYCSCDPQPPVPNCWGAAPVSPVPGC